MAELKVVDPPADLLSGLGKAPANPFYNPPLTAKDETALPDDMAKELTTLDEGTVVLTLPKELSADSVQEFSYWINGVLRRMRRKAGMAPEAKS